MLIFLRWAGGACGAQEDDTLHGSKFDLEDYSHWHVLDANEELASLDTTLPTPIRPSQLNTHQEEERLEAELRQLLAGHRERALAGEPSGNSCNWDSTLCRLLMPALSAYECEACTGVAPGNTEFQQAIKRAVPTGHTFKGFPRQFNHRSATLMAHTLLREPVVTDILSTVGQAVKFAVRVKVFAYPEDLCSVWVMLAVKFKGLEGVSS